MSPAADSRLMYVNLEYVGRCESLFQRFYEIHAQDRGLLQLIAQQLMGVSAPVACASFPKLKFVNLFVKLRM